MKTGTIEAVSFMNQDISFVSYGDCRYLHIAANAEQLAQTAAGFIFRFIAQQVASARFRMALSGGRTPAMLYEALRTRHGDSPIWRCVDFFWSDERMVPHDHADSNYRLALLGLLQPLAIPPLQIFPVPTHLHPATAVAAAYEQDVCRQLGPQPVFDLILLGLGDDGHTASLFPGTAAVDETKAWVAANYVDKMQTWRITFTYPLLNSAKKILFLAAGANKARVLADIISGNNDWPAARVGSPQGDVYWLVDEEAASIIKPSLASNAFSQR
jgi:6-phosphogluconolactonase